MVLSILPQDIELTPERQKTLAHSKTVANAAKLIAQKTSHLDPEKAYGFGLMHDIGKFYLDRSFAAVFIRDAYTLEVVDPMYAEFLIALVVAYDNIRDQHKDWQGYNGTEQNVRVIAW